jgi:hypothetical protein
MYTKAQTARLETFESVSYDQAVELAVELGQTLKSIISKVQFLGIPYIKKAVPAPKPVQTTKAELVVSIQNRCPAIDLSGLVGATRDALVALDAYLPG